jgi:arylsulfatase A-like enzyme
MHIPLLFVGNLIKPGIITKQVRHVDIFPTICELLGIPLDIKISGKSLVLHANESLQDENPNYLHTIPYQKSSPLDMVGVRTSRYKYFRSAHNANENIHLYDLKNDPYENNNIAQTHKQLVAQLEKKMLKLEKDSLSEYKEEISDKEMERITNELKRLGYIKS